MSELATSKTSQQQVWASDDFAMIATTMIITSELLCEAVDLRAGQTVLDVATGSGNAALAAARRWCRVTGIDFSPDLLERARERAAAERFPVTFREGDAEQLPFPDAAFDVVLSTSGVMFAPDQAQAARELLRVCRPGGKIGLANLMPESFSGEHSRIMQQYSPLLHGHTSPFLWGTETRLHELFGDSIMSLQCTRRTFIFRYQSADHFLEVWRTHHPPTRSVFERLDAAGQERLARDLLDLTRRYNRSGDATMVVPNAYLEVVAIKR